MNVAGLVEAQAAGDCRAESLVLQSMFPVRKRSGRQHSDVPAHERLLSSVRFGASDCWHWCGVTNNFGYGRFSFRGRTQVAHRVSYETFCGPIPEGMSVLHRCDNPSCINPDHLWLGTYSDNRRDCIAKRRWTMRDTRGFKNKTTVVTPDMLVEMRRRRSDGESYAEIGRGVGVSTMTAWHALNGRFGEVQ